MTERQPHSINKAKYIKYDRGREILDTTEVLNPAHTALMIVDMQVDLVGYRGSMSSRIRNAYKRFTNMTSSIKDMVTACRELDVPVVWVKQVTDPETMNDNQYYNYIAHGGWMGAVCLKDGPGHEIIPDLKGHMEEEDIVVTKTNSHDPFQAVTAGNNPLDLHSVLQLRRPPIKTLIVCGVTTESCVLFGINNANDRGYYTVLLRDAVESTQDNLQEAGLLTAGRIATDVMSVPWTTHYLRQGRG